MTGADSVQEPRRWGRGMGTWRRRGLLAGLAGVVAGVMARQTEQPAEAGHNGSVGANPLHLGLNNTNDTNVITTVTAGVANGFAFRVDNNASNGSGITGEGTGLGNGVRGTATGAAGVLGTASAVGVLGECTATTGIGVRGNSIKIGLFGASNPNPASIPSGGEPAAGIIGIGEFIGGLGRATITTGSRHGLTGRVGGSAPFGIAVDAQAPDGAIGVRGMSGVNTIDPDVKIGVQGISQQAGGIGVRGDGGAFGVDANGGVGVRGRSAGSTGIFGVGGSSSASIVPTTGDRIGVHGVGIGVGSLGVRGDAPNVGVIGTSDSGTGIFGTSQTGAAGLFFGPVTVNGDFTVTGAKSAAVPLPGGTLGRTYALECPDSWLADFGEGQLTDGFRRVPIDPKFGSTVDLSGQYHVLITPLADAMLYVTNRTSESFDVHISSFGQRLRDLLDRDGRNSSPTPKEPIRFTWWVIGRRKDIKGPRFEEVKLPPMPKLS
jgi:hypothetical protein